MKKLLLIALLAVSTASYAAETPATAEPGKPAVQQKFDAAKSKRLKRIGDRIAELQKAQSCVEAAADFNALEGCDSPRFKKRMEKRAAAKQ